MALHRNRASTSNGRYQLLEAVVQRCFLTFRKIHRKTPVPESAGLTYNFIKKQVLEHVVYGEFCGISKNAFSYRTHPVAASEL